MDNSPHSWHKVRSAVKAFGQKEGVDFEEIILWKFLTDCENVFFPVILDIATRMNLEIEQLDIKVAFLHGDLEEEIYTEQLKSFGVKSKEHLGCKLKRPEADSLVIVQVVWFVEASSKLLAKVQKAWFLQTTTLDHCAFLKRYHDDFIIILPYADNSLIF